MSLGLYESQAENQITRKIREPNMTDNSEDINGVLEREDFLYVLEIIGMKLISSYHNNLLTYHFGMNKTGELIAQKYYRSSLQANVKAYVKAYNVYLAFK